MEQIRKDSINDSNEKEIAMANLRQKVSQCLACPLSKTRTNTVPGEGNPSADILFIGEAPGATEDQKGIPFCGAAGKFLDQMLASIDLKRDDVFIANTVKCRPPLNRDPEDLEKDACRPFLNEQFEIIKPRLVVLLGKHSTATYLPGAGTISALHGKALKRPNGIVYLPLYHPAAALHNGGLRQTLMDDFSKIPAILKKINSTEENIETKSTQQKLL